MRGSFISMGSEWTQCSLNGWALLVWRAVGPVDPGRWVLRSSEETEVRGGGPGHFLGSTERRRKKDEPPPGGS